MEEKLKQKPSDLVKVVLFGPESTGKTTLAEDLAIHFETEWVPEYMREYLEEKWDHEKKMCEPEDLLPIAEGQMTLENSLTSKVKELLICDTNLLELKVYSEAYYNGYCPPLIQKNALENKYNLYLLTAIDVPWEEDNLRDKPHDREFMFSLFKKALDIHKMPYVILKGDRQKRLQVAINQIEKLLEKK
ncbi:ATP-binding protein [Galbibacter sp. EGI 63066]|uniref:ATP-binding protein n=1 Tax=Galbibacter sp. EGI 63066 TaxID=2993559 RepID=UPI002248B330|nr:ATP-binding protein [Galbibacter sp. EGI 63066]MCX2681026.1 ATP-binding protein [Galbibacter sp. EGI 63066]